MDILMRPKIIIDTDIGDDIDDAFALLLAVLSPDIELVGVTTVFRDAKKRAKIASYFLKSMCASVPVRPGCDLPLNGEAVHGDHDKIDALGHPIMSHYFKAFDEEPVSSTHAVDFILDAVRRDPDNITLVSIGPMTNLARAYQKDPVTFRQLKGILFMGGHPTSQFKEWNIRCDIEAAKIVFDSGVRLKMVGLNVTAKSGLTASDLKRIRNWDDTGFRRELKHMLDAYVEFFDGKRLPILHDPLTLSCLTHDFCTFSPMRLDVITEGAGRGRTMIAKGSDRQEIDVAVDVDASAFIAFMFEMMEQTSPRLSEYTKEVAQC
jgi:purine nucleosidase